MAVRKVLRIVSLQQLLFLCSVLTFIKCKTAAFSDLSESDENNIVEIVNSSETTDKTDLPTKCTIRVDNSKNFFSSKILQYKLNFVYLKLNFTNFSITETEDVIAYNRWVWTYKANNGGYQKLFLPNYHGYLSFGLLWTHTFVGPMRLNLIGSGNCNNLTSGEKTDKMLGEALGEMTNEIASQNDVYNSSYWCYVAPIKLHGIGRFMCENTGCPFQTFGYRCCKYKINYVTRRRMIKCNKKHYRLGTVWWNLVIYLGNLLWINFPLLLTYFGYKLTEAKESTENDVAEMDDVLNSENKEITEEYVFFDKHTYPITILGTIKKAFFCNVRNTLASRLLRFMIIFLPLAILIVKILITLKFEGNFIRAASSKGASPSFNALILDFQSAKERFLVIFGGPHVAFSLYVLFSCIFIQIPRDLESFLVQGLFNFECLGLSPLTLSLDTKCRLAGLQCSNMSGFRKLHLTLAGNMLLLLNKTFWKHTFRIFFYRWKSIIYTFLETIHPRSLLAAICVPLIAAYVIFCIFELVITLLLYIFPLVSFPLILFKAYVNIIIDFSKGCSKNFVKAIFYILIPATILALSFTWYMYSLVFGACIWYFIIIILYTYSGVIAYPRISYGYLILVFMTIYYIVEIFNKFGKSYQKLLHVTIKTCKKVNHISIGRTVEIKHDKGVPKKLWELIVERHQARRLKVASAFLRLTILISVLYVSVNLLERFDQFQELSVITHVFTVLAVCALPKIVKSVYIDKLCGQNKRKLVRDIENTVHDFLEDNIDHIQIYRDHEYQEISG